MLVLSILVQWVLLAASVALAAWVVPDVSLEGGPLATMWVAALIALANVLVLPLTRLLPPSYSLPVLALLTLAVNGLGVWIASALTSYLTVDGFLPAVGAAIMISVFSVVLTALAVRLRHDTGSHTDATADP